VSDGVDVVLDIWQLKEGDDKYAFIALGPRRSRRRMHSRLALANQVTVVSSDRHPKVFVGTRRATCVNHSLSTLLRIAYVAVGPLILILVGTQIILLVAYAVAFAGYGGNEKWLFLGVLDVPTAARSQIVGGCIAAILVSVVVYGMYLRAVGRVLRKHNLKFIEFAQKPLRERRLMLDSVKKMRRRT